MRWYRNSEYVDIAFCCSVNVFAAVMNHLRRHDWPEEMIGLKGLDLVNVEWLIIANMIIPELSTFRHIRSNYIAPVSCCRVLVMDESS